MPVKVVNMIPNSLSNETTRDSEPNISATFVDPSRIAASVFTPDPMGSGNAPIYVSTDGGDTWVLNVLLPGGNKTNDTTLRFAGLSNVLYAGILRTDNGDLNILRASDFTAPTLMTVLVTKTNDDQPYVSAGTVMAGPGAGSDRVYVGENDFGAASGHTATVDLSLDAATAAPPAGFGTHSIETRATSGQDGPPTRPAVHLDGTVYAVYVAWRSGTTQDIVVVRDDNWGSSATPFTDLVDGDGSAGERVVIGASRCPFLDTLGTQRVGANAAIAVDPRDSSIVYIAWADGATAAAQTIRVRRSTDRGVTWSTDLITASAATNAALAVNSQGAVGLLYQQLHNPGSGNKWQTHLVTSSNAFTTRSDLILADVPDANGSYTSANPIGDYAGLIAVGKNFYGIFCGNNTPDNANFPNGVTYQRNADFTTHTLKDLSNNSVAVSIDPFFAKLTTVDVSDDFYVRDWTDSPTSCDNGAEPSTHNVFYATSDVWNRRGTLPGPFPNDQPSNEDAGNGAGNIGDNWAFARIRRNPPSTGAQTVTAHFLVSKFGTGSNYVDSTSADPDLSFPDPDPTINFAAANMGPEITTAYHWHLNAVASTHLCLAVEISTPNDPFVPPSLVGNTPGWPTTDLRIINDNNKAQRNMGLTTTPARGVGMSDCYHGIVHNPATFPRDIELRIEVPNPAGFANATIDLVAGDRQPIRNGSVIRLPNVQPGESRWVGLQIPAMAGKEGEIHAVYFSEVVNGVLVNGFGMGARLASLPDVFRSKLEVHRSVFTRMAADFKPDGGEKGADAAAKLAGDKNLNEAAYVAFMRSQLSTIQHALTQLVQVEQGKDPFSIAATLKNFATAVDNGQADAISVAHSCLLQRTDAFLTMRLLANGDVADILQNVRWTRDLYTRAPRLSKLGCAPDLRAACSRFISEYGLRKQTNRNYPELVKQITGCLSFTADALGDETLRQGAQQLSDRYGDLRLLQKAHRDLLLRLQQVLR